jgi:hypothetical protein
MMAASIALVLRMEVSLAPLRISYVERSGGKEVRVIDCSISAAIFHLSPSAQEGRTVTRKIMKEGRIRVMVSSLLFRKIKDWSQHAAGVYFFGKRVDNFGKVVGWGCLLYNSERPTAIFR